MKEAAAVLGGYLLGSLPFAYWVPRIFRGEDIRSQGSGNVGASNVFRAYGRSLGIPVALLDVAKGFAAASLGLWAGGALVGVLAGAAAMVGHARPVFLRFEKGGKMAATAGGATFALAPLVAFCCVGIWLLTFALTRYASVATIATAVAAMVPGTVVAEAVRPRSDRPEPAAIRIGHPYGVMDAVIRATDPSDPATISAVAVGRTARHILDGTVWVRRRADPRAP